jgi:hypothetical protein
MRYAIHAEALSHPRATNQLAHKIRKIAIRMNEITRQKAIGDG